MSANEIHQNDIGTMFKATIKDDTEIVDLSSATELRMIFGKPDGSSVNKEALLYTNGTDGIIKYVSISGDLDLIGMWSLQGSIVIDENRWKSDIRKFRVHRNL